MWHKRFVSSSRAIFDFRKVITTIAKFSCHHKSQMEKHCQCIWIICFFCFVLFCITGTPGGFVWKYLFNSNKCGCIAIILHIRFSWNVTTISVAHYQDMSCHRMQHPGKFANFVMIYSCDAFHFVCFTFCSLFLSLFHFVFSFSFADSFVDRANGWCKSTHKNCTAVSTNVLSIGP